MGSLVKEVLVDRMEILEDSQIQVRTATRVLEDGVVISQTFHRHVVEPDMDQSVIDSQDKRVKDVCGVLYTQEVKDKYAVEKAKQRTGGPK